MRFFRDYARLIAFAAGILVGVQIPNFIDQYAKRISAHYSEARTNFVGYQDTADKHFGGNVEALIAHYEKSKDAVFQDDARNISRIYKRIQEFADELKALEASLFAQIFHVAFRANPEALQETFSEYSSTVPLNREAVACALAVGLAASLALEFLLYGLYRIGTAFFRKKIQKIPC